MKIEVKNVNGSSRFAHPAGYESWLDYWKDNCNVYFMPDCCPCCNLPPLTGFVGAHVQKTSGLDKKMYIVPICKSCNGKPDLKFNVDEAYLVPSPRNL